MGIDAPKELNFVKCGKLNLIALRNGKDVEKVATDSVEFLPNPRVVRSGGVMLDVVTFQPHCVFKVTLGFKRPLPCTETSARESTDWVLVSCLGTMAHYNRVEERLVLQQCVVSLQSNVEPLRGPLQMVLAFDEDEWVVEKIFR